MALPALVIDGPIDRPLPRGRFVDIAQPLGIRSTINGDASNRERWIGGGVTWIPWNCSPLYTIDVDACALGNFAGAIRDCDPAITATAFGIYDLLRASALDFTPDDIESFLRKRISTAASAAIVNEVIAGTISADKGLAKVAHQPFKQTGGASAPIPQTLAKIEDELCRQLDGSQGMIFLPPGMLGIACEEYGLILNPTTGQFETALGNLIVADAGLSDSVKPTYSGTAAGANTDWIYGSGMVHFAMTEIDMIDGGNVGSTMTNFIGTDFVSGQAPQFRTRDTFLRIAAMYAIIVFDPCGVTAALATYESEDTA